MNRHVMPPPPGTPLPVDGPPPPPGALPPPDPSLPVPIGLNSPSAVRILRWLIFSVVVVLVLEGLGRKLYPATGIFMFFFKDFITFGILLQVSAMKRPPPIQFIWKAYMIACLFFIPEILLTATNDPILAVFGTKQYLLYPVIAVAVYTAYYDATERDLLSFYRALGLLVVPTMLLALYELHLPDDHWLNLSVVGESVAGFEAGGELRVSSSFSFVSQYCLFLNTEMYIVIIAISNLGVLRPYQRFLFFGLVPCLVLSCYITGSRGAVIGNMAIVGVACVLSLFKFESKVALRIGLIVSLIAISICVLPTIFPRAFAAYSEREGGHLVRTTGEVTDRVGGALFGWTDEMLNTPIFGYGLGIMSNGADRLSDYARTYRSYMWTETDFASTVFEGGFYLAVVWYGLRYYVVVATTRRFLRFAGGEFTLPGAFCQGFVVVMGVTGTLGIQPPAAIWFWFAVGSGQLFCTRSIIRQDQEDREKYEAPPPPPPPVFRGRSAYAERLHG